MKILLIHQVEEWMLDLDLTSFDIITFDDGLYTQYKFHKEFLQLKKPLYFFISTSIICNGNQRKTYIKCNEAHDLYFNNGDTSHYMTWKQIHELKDNGCIIGGHSDTHPYLNNMSFTKQLKESYNQSKIMMKKFDAHNINITSFAYPYNFKCAGYNILKSFGVTQFFGDERIEIETLKR